MNRQGPAQAREGALFFGRDELAEGLMLFRAGTLRMIRLQLAMEQHDRRVALETVDDLVALDLQLQDYLAHLPEPVAPELMHDLEDERAALNREKLALAAGVIRREAAPPVAEPIAVTEAWGSRDFAGAEERRQRRGLLRLVAGLIVVSALAGATFVTGVRDALGQAMADMGAAP